jgi:hypothetical protein
MDAALIKEDLRANKARLTDLRRALKRGVHRNELLVAAQQTVDELTCLLEEAPEFDVPINDLLDRYEKLVTKLLN